MILYPEYFVGSLAPRLFLFSSQTPTMIIGYARVSTQQQSLEMQEEALREYGCERIYSEKKSGKNNNREQLKTMLDHLRAGDTVVVHSLSRLGRTLKGILTLLDHFREHEIHFIALTENLHLNDSAMGQAMINLFGVMAQLQRDLTREKTMKGLEVARKNGRVGGRPRGLSEESKKKAQLVATMYRSQDYSVREICRIVNVAQSTLYNYLDILGVKRWSHSRKLVKKAS